MSSVFLLLGDQQCHQQQGYSSFKVELPLNPAYTVPLAALLQIIGWFGIRGQAYTPDTGTPGTGTNEDQPTRIKSANGKYCPGQAVGSHFGIISL